LEKEGKLAEYMKQPFYYMKMIEILHEYTLLL